VKNEVATAIHEVLVNATEEGQPLKGRLQIQKLWLNILFNNIGPQAIVKHAL
jgi:hypothetical protein